MKKSKKLQFHPRESGRGCDSSSSVLYKIKQCHRDVMASVLFHFFSAQEHALGEPMQMSIHEISSQSSSPHTDIDSGKFWNNFFLALKYLIFMKKCLISLPMTKMFFQRRSFAESFRIFCKNAAFSWGQLSRISWIAEYTSKVFPHTAASCNCMIIPS